MNCVLNLIQGLVSICIVAVRRRLPYYWGRLYDSVIKVWHRLTLQISSCSLVRAGLGPTVLNSASVWMDVPSAKPIPVEGMQSVRWGMASHPVTVKKALLQWKALVSEVSDKNVWHPHCILYVVAVLKSHHVSLKYYICIENLASEMSVTWWNMRGKRYTCNVLCKVRASIVRVELLVCWEYLTRNSLKWRTRVECWILIPLM